MKCIPVAVFVMLAIPGIPGQYGQVAIMDGWTGVRMDTDRRVIDAQPLVDLAASNVRQCLRMCWLFRACSALTFTLRQKRCHLVVLSGSDVGAYRLAIQTGSQSVDMRKAQIDSKMTTPRGCDKRPCTESEMCAPVKDYAFHVCIKLASEFCRADPPSVPHSSTERDNVGSVVYTCAHGYFQTGTTHISECDRHSKTWSEVDTTCSFVECGVPPSVHGATSSGTGTSTGSVVTYSCLTGAVPTSADMTSTCVGSTAQWSPISEQCEAVSCGQPPQIAAMDVELVARSLVGAFPGLDEDELAVAYGGEALYVCIEGYTALDGTRYMSQCQTDGTWSSTEHFQCSPVDCGLPPIVANASAANYNDTLFGHNATITCLPGFSPQESVTFTCNATGNWEGPEMACEPNNCGPPPEVELTILDHDTTTDAISTTVGSVVNYICLAVAIPTSNEMSSTCNWDLKKWNPTPSPCSLVICGDPPTLDNMTYTLTSRQQVVEAIPWMPRDDILRAYGGEAVYSCKQGYNSTAGASYVSRCQADGSWSSTTDFLCSPLRCGQPPIIDNLNQLTLTTTMRFGESVTVQCLPGFLPLGGIVWRCNASGLWEADGDEGCRPVDCGEPGPVDSATVNYTETNIGSEAHYSCIQPSVSIAEDNSTATCLETGQWSPVSISCRPVPCGTAPQVSHARVNYILEDDQFKANYTCHGPTINCLNLGSVSFWGRSLVVCGVISCGDAPEVPNANVTLTGSAYPYSAIYTCHPGYFLSSNTSNRTCQENAAWSSEEVTCSEIQCGLHPSLPQNAVFTPPLTADSTFTTGDSLSFECLVGFTMVPAKSTLDVGMISSVKCLGGNQTWGPPEPEVLCVPEICDVPPFIPSTTWSLQAGPPHTVTYSCLVGYTLSAAAPPATSHTYQSSPALTSLTSECTPLGGWIISASMQGGCLEIDCGQIPAQDNLEVPVAHDTKYGSKVNVSCTPPFYLNNQTNTMECGLDGQWSNLDTSHVCAPCNQSIHASGIPNSVLELDLSSGPVADKAHFTCEYGYYALKAPDEIRCASVDNFAIWQGLEKARCTQIRWEDPSPVNTNPTRYHVTIDKEACCSGGLSACGVVTFTGKNDIMYFILTEAEGNSVDFTPAMQIKYNAGYKILTLTQSPEDASQDNLVTKVSIDLIQAKDTATFCIVLDVELQRYQFTMNATSVADMPVINTRFNRFAIKQSVNVALMTLDYNYQASRG